MEYMLIEDLRYLAYIWDFDCTLMEYYKIIDIKRITDTVKYSILYVHVYNFYVMPSSYPHVENITNMTNWAAANGHLELLKYFRSIERASDGKYCKNDAMIFAAQYGHLEIVKYLHEIGKTCTKWIMYNTSYEMELAAKNGHLEIVKYLHEMGNYCSKKIINDVVKNGHLNVVEYLNKNNTLK